MKRNWSPGDLDYAARLKRQPGGGGGWVYLSRAHIEGALKLGAPIDAHRLVAVRTVLEPGSGQILIRLRAVK